MSCSKNSSDIGKSSKSSSKDGDSPKFGIKKYQILMKILVFLWFSLILRGCSETLWALFYTFMGSKMYNYVTYVRLTRIYDQRHHLMSLPLKKSTWSVPLTCSELDSGIKKLAKITKTMKFNDSWRQWRNIVFRIPGSQTSALGHF